MSSNHSVRCGVRFAAFTLIELMIVVVLIGVLAAIAIPAFQKLTKRSQNTTFANDLRTAVEGVQRYSLENGRFPVGDGTQMPDEILLQEYLPSPLRWRQKTPIGGLWALSSGTAAAPYKAVLIVNGYGGGNARANDVDKMVDDGNLANGFLRGDVDKLTYILEQ